MNKKYLRTIDIARSVGVHPNTVRGYEKFGLLPPIPRNAKGYRLFTEEHLNLMRLGRAILHWPYPGGSDIVYALVRQAAKGDLGGALEKLYAYLTRVKTEIARAETAVELLEHWAAGIAIDNTAMSLSMTETVELLDITKDALRNWERNGLIRVPRNPKNNYRIYGSREIARLRVIRVLRNAKYSMMSILRMMLEFDRGRKTDLCKVLDTPRQDEDVYSVTDKWISSLAEVEKKARTGIKILEEMISKSKKKN
jgi:DNA-binding transcriptional MerR regulator